LRGFVILGVAAATLVAGLAVFLWIASQGAMYRFDGLTGPDGRSSVPAIERARIADFGAGSNHRLAILVTDPDSGWLGLARGLKSHGIPFRMTTSVPSALQHKVVFAYPMISGRTLKANELTALAKHVHDGGHLLAFDVEGGGLEPLFGISSAPAPVPADALVWSTASSVPQERETRISRAGTEAAVGALAYPESTGEVLARYPDGQAGLICRRAVGRACVLGVDIGALTQRAFNGRGEGIARSYVNAYEPSLDTLYAWLADFYVEGEPMPLLIDSAPPGKDVSIILTHDIDFTNAVASARRTAAALRADGVSGTFFMQTKYVRDFNDDVFFRKEMLGDVKGVLADKMEIGSHSVAHAKSFKDFDFGTGAESYPDYRPFVQSSLRARGGSVLGELRVSKFLLEHMTGAKVVSFRAGHLSNPFRLPEGLAATGYLSDSSITANSCLTHLPFRLTVGRGDSALAPAYEFPVTIEDEAAPKLSKRLGAAHDLIGAIARMHGLAVVLMHPDPAGETLAFERNLVARWRDRAWFATMTEFADWWRARDALELDVRGGPGAWTLDIPAGQPGSFMIRAPKAGQIIGPPGADITFHDNAFQLGPMPAGGRIVLN
jgi:peptidoglycan/xylan/chitin deacetylase (PgdA/CDA1 family)